MAVLAGPGSFTGLRAALSFGHGFALGLEIELWPVTVAEAFAAVLPAAGPPLWTAVDSLRGDLFVETGSGWSVLSRDQVLAVHGAARLAGNGSDALAARLGEGVIRTGLVRAEPLGIAGAAWRRAAGLLPAMVATPLYVHPPAARPAA